MHNPLYKSGNRIHMIGLDRCYIKLPPHLSILHQSLLTLPNFKIADHSPILLQHISADPNRKPSYKVPTWVIKNHKFISELTQAYYESPTKNSAIEQLADLKNIVISLSKRFIRDQKIKVLPNSFEAL